MDRFLALVIGFFSGTVVVSRNFTSSAPSSAVYDVNYTVKEDNTTITADTTITTIVTSTTEMPTQTTLATSYTLAYSWFVSNGSVYTKIYTDVADMYSSYGTTTYNFHDYTYNDATSTTTYSWYGYIGSTYSTTSTRINKVPTTSSTTASDIGDVNRDGRIDAIDASIISSYYAYLSTKPDDEPTISIIEFQRISFVT